MARWKLLARNPAGDIELTAAKSRRLTYRLDQPSEAAFSINARTEQADELNELATHIIAIRDKQTLYRGVLGSTQDQAGPDQHTINATSLDLRARLDGLQVEAPLTYTGIDQAAIAWALITHAQAQTGGNLGLTQGLGQATGILRDRTYEPGKKIGEAIWQLSQVIDGFDWDINPETLALDIHYPQRGRTSDLVLEYGAAVAGFSRQVTTSDYANAIRQTGADGLNPATREAADLADRPEGRYTRHFSDSDLSLQTTVDERADWQLDQAQTIRPAWTVTLRKGAWQGPDELWLGDTAKLVVKSGRLDVDTELRVYEITVTLGDSGQEDVQVTLGAPRPDFRRRFSDADRRLDTLERR